MMENRIHDYWEKNIGNWAEFYDKNSEENIAAPRWLKPIYRKFIFPIERDVTRKRFELVKNYVLKNFKAGDKVVDLGCGSGIFTELLLNEGAEVIACDFAETALAMTKKRIQPQNQQKLSLQKVNIMDQAIPKAKLCICVGVVPYLYSIEKFLQHTLPHVDSLWFNFLDKTNNYNRIRRGLPFLNVRYYYYHDPKKIEKICNELGFKVVQKDDLGTGLAFEVQRSS